MTELKLTIELVPRTSWYNNMRGAVCQSDWDKIRRETYAHFNHKCGICQKTSTLHCHEIWQYDDANSLQSLSGFIALCEWCHHVKHIGHAGILAREGKLDYEKVVQHFMRVNNCDRPIFESYVAQAFSIWKKRSKHNWKVNLGFYSDLVTGA